MKFIIDDAPGKELIPLIIKNLAFQDFKSFYDKRVAWGEGPLIQERVITYGMYDDFINELQSEMEPLKVLFDFSMSIAEQEKDQDFVLIFYLITEICLKINKVNGFTEDILLKIKMLKPRVEKLQSESSYFIDFWEVITNRMATHASFVKEDFLLK